MSRKKLIRKIGLTMLYTVVLGSIVFAFPKKSGSEELGSTFSSAPKTISPNFTLPVHIIGGSSTQTTPNNATTSSGTTKTTTVPVIKRSTLSCADINVCNKIHFSDVYTSAQKVKYYTALLQTVSSLQSFLPQSPSLSDTIFSITLTPESTGNERRGRGGSKTILLQTKNMATLQEFREVLTHELAHIVDLGMLIGANREKNTDFTIADTINFATDDPSLSFYKISWTNSTTRLASASYLDFVGGYAMSSPYEDFAESFTMYLRHNDIFKQWTAGSTILKQKYDFINNLVQGHTLSTSKTPQDTITWRPRDVTRMSLE